MKIKYIFFITFFIIRILHAHDLWIQKENQHYVLYYGHLNPKENESKLIPYEPQNILRFDCFNKESKLITAKIEKRYPAKLTGDCDVVFAIFSSGYWTKTIYGLKNLPKNEVEKPIESWLSYESVKKIEVWSENFIKPLSDQLEITALQNPLNKKIGDKITFVVYYKQKPVKDLVVAYHEKPIGTTDEDGKINIRIKQNGLQMISATLKEKGDGIKSDHIIYTTILSFEVNK